MHHYILLRWAVRSNRAVAALPEHSRVCVGTDEASVTPFLSRERAGAGLWILLRVLLGEEAGSFSLHGWDSGVSSGVLRNSLALDVVSW